MENNEPKELPFDAYFKGSVIKYAQAPMSCEELHALHCISDEEYEIYKAKEAEEEEAKAVAAAEAHEVAQVEAYEVAEDEAYEVAEDEAYEEAETEASEIPDSTTNDGKTFWQNDTGERLNMSQDDFSDFLANNSLNIQNSAAVDIEALLAAQQDDVTE